MKNAERNAGNEMQKCQKRNATTEQKTKQQTKAENETATGNPTTEMKLKT